MFKRWFRWLRWRRTPQKVWLMVEIPINWDPRVDKHPREWVWGDVPELDALGRWINIQARDFKEIR